MSPLYWWYYYNSQEDWYLGGLSLHSRSLHAIEEWCHHGSNVNKYFCVSLDHVKNPALLKYQLGNMDLNCTWPSSDTDNSCGKIPVVAETCCQFTTGTEVTSVLDSKINMNNPKVWFLLEALLNRASKYYSAGSSP